MNNWEIEYENKEQLKLTVYQKNVVKRIMNGHVTDINYTGKASITVTPYFTSVWFYYYPSDAVNNPYLSCVKHVFVGKKGAIQKFMIKHGIGKESNIKKIAKYYMKAENN